MIQYIILQLSAVLLAEMVGLVSHPTDVVAQVVGLEGTVKLVS